jgi:signal transduction histidine kinase
MTLRQLPVLFIGLVLVAWHYNLAAVLLYSVGTNLFEFWTVNLFGPFDTQRLTIFYFLTVIRTISFVVVGIFITQLITRLRLQQEALRSANRELAHHASTLENLAVSRERNRLARELHDTLAHTLSGLTVQLETVKAYWDVKPETARQLLAQALMATRSGLDETRRALKALRASPLEDLGLLLALHKLSESAAERGNLRLEMALPEHLPLLPPDVEQCIYRVAQEAVENVVHHADAKKLAVQLSFNAAEICLSVADDGRGMDLAQAGQDGHYGLAGMRERAQLVGGKLRVSSKPDQGTHVRLEIKGYPLHESDYL